MVLMNVEDLARSCGSSLFVGVAPPSMVDEVVDIEVYAGLRAALP